MMAFNWKDYLTVNRPEIRIHKSYICGSYIAWKSKTGKVVTLSSTEAE
jgi:hypothetical protein